MAEQELEAIDKWQQRFEECLKRQCELREMQMKMEMDAFAAASEMKLAALFLSLSGQAVADLIFAPLTVLKDR